MVADSAVALLAAVTGVLVAAHLLGVLAGRLGFAPVVGELVTGLVLGPAVLGVAAPGVAAHFVPVPDSLVVLSALGLVFLVVLAGSEVDAAAVRRDAATTAALALGAFGVPFLAGFALAWALPAAVLAESAGRLALALFLGTALSVSALPVAVRVLASLDALDSRVGQQTLTVAAVVDAAGWVALAVVADIALAGRVDAGRLGRTVVVLAAFVLVAATAGVRVVDALFRATSTSRSPALTGFSVVTLVGFVAALAAAAAGLEAVLGAFAGGVVAGRRLDDDARRVLQVVTLAFFGPLFFATAGLRVDLGGLLTPTVAGVAVATFAVAVASKALGVALGAAFTDLSRAETVCLAVSLNARGAMEIVVATLGLTLGVLSPALYAVVVTVAIATTVLTPPLLRRALARLPDNP